VFSLGISNLVNSMQNQARATNRHPAIDSLATRPSPLL